MTTTASNTSFLYPVGPLLMGPAPETLATLRAEQAAREQQRLTKGAPPPEKPYMEFWLEDACQHPQLWQGQCLRGPVIGMAYRQYNSLCLDTLVFLVTDGEEFFAFLPPALGAFLKTHASKMLVSSYGVHFRCGFDPHGRYYIHGAEQDNNPPDPYVELYWLHRALEQGDRRFVKGNHALAREWLNRPCKDTVSQARLRPLYQPQRLDYDWHQMMCQLHGQALAGVLLYRLLRQEILSATQDEHRRIQEEMARSVRVLPGAALADLTTPNPEGGVVLEGNGAP